MGVRSAPMKIGVQGLWHLGSVTAAGLASMGHEVTGLDFDAATVAGLLIGKAPIFEPGLDAVLQSGLAAGRLQFINSAEALPTDIELMWITYDTPVDTDDVADVEFVISQVKSSLLQLPVGATVLVSSQLPVGSVQRLERMAAELCADKGLGFAYSPENLRLGKALDVFLKPDRVVVGTRSERDRNRIAAALQPIDAHVEWMSVESAEMTKHAINAFLATSVVFANEIATLCERVGADAKEVERGLKSEQRIGPKAYLSPGGAFAGGTLARDIEFLKTIGHREHLRIPMLESVRVSNDFHKGWVRHKLTKLFPLLEDVAVAVWGLTYKPGTNTLRRSLSVELCDWMLEQGAQLTVHDPSEPALPSRWQGRVSHAATALKALIGAKVLIVGTEWPVYKEVLSLHAAEAAPGLVVLDANRFLAPWPQNPALQYLAVGTPTREL